MKKLLLLILCLSGIGLRAQNVLMNTTRDQLNSSGLVLPTNGTVWGLPSGNKGETIGSPYLDTLWAQGNLKLYESLQPIGGKPVDTLSGLALRYNVQFNELEILLNTHKDVKALQGYRIKSFSLKREGKEAIFVNTKLYEGEKLSPGFFEIMVPGKLPLVFLYKVVVRKPTYNVAYDTGEKDTKIILDKDFFVLRANKAYKFKPTRKNLLELMNDKSAEVNAYLETNHPDFKSRQDLERVFELYNSL